MRIRDIRFYDSQMVDSLSVKSIRNFNCPDKYILQNIYQKINCLNIHSHFSEADIYL